MKSIYLFFIRLYPLVVQLVGLSNAKARLWVAGRKDIFKKLNGVFTGNQQPVVWMHCASLGEFEQGKPVLEKLRNENPAAKILLTFFSPSGYEIRKDYKGADWIFYLPMDSPSNAKRFLDLVQPQLIVFVKYEFWYYYLTEAKQRAIPLLLVSGIFRDKQSFFKWYGGFYRQMLYCFTHFFVQNNHSAQLLASIGIRANVTISGDTRFDRVIDIATHFTPISLIEQFIGNHPVIVAGSTWTDDDEELDHYANTHPGTRFIIAPHDIGESRIKECLALYRNAVLFSELIKTGVTEEKNHILIIDNIGLLSRLYHYATVCYVGGGFGNDGVHNVLEAAVYNKPVVIGPVYEKFVEAIGLVEAGGAFSIENALELEQTCDQLMEQGEYYQEACTNAGRFVQEYAGATSAVMDYIQKNRLLTN